MAPIYIPKKIRVGYQERPDTYNGKLAFAVPIEDSGKVRQQRSFDGWRHHKHGTDDYPNVPTTGFVLNKNVGGYKSDWNYRRAMVRVFDPRGFEIEITLGNLLFILENVSTIKGKGIDGEMIYGWDGKNVVLVPCDTEYYSGILAFQDIVEHKDKITAKTVIPGAIYLSKKNQELIYLGHFDYYGWDRALHGKRHYLLGPNGLETVASLSGLVKLVDPNPVPDYAYLMDDLQHSRHISPLVDSASRLVPYTWEEYLLQYGGWSRANMMCDIGAGKAYELQLYADLRAAETGTRYLTLAESHEIQVTYYAWWKLEEDLGKMGAAVVKANLESVSGKYDLKSLFDYFRPVRWAHFLANGREHGKSIKRRTV